MPLDKSLEFVGIDEIQMCNDHERGHIFTDRLLNLRGEKLTMLMGSNTIKSIIEKLDDDIEFINKERFSKLSYNIHGNGFLIISSKKKYGKRLYKNSLWKIRHKNVQEND